MSSERAMHKSIKTHKNLLQVDGIRSEQTQSTSRIDIRDLFSRMREKEKKEKKENLYFAGVAGSIVIIAGIIASL
jgi:hypothetical protein